MGHQLFDNHNRPLNYLRLAVTDRCNLRCFYCMPEEGINYLPKKDLLSFEEIIRLISLMADMGITKVRITGGEPFVRKDLNQLLENITAIQGIEELHITTNGVLTAQHIPFLKSIGIKSVNLSLDTLDERRFFQITRRNVYKDVMHTLDALLAADIPTKINVVVMEGQNIEDIIPLIELGKNQNIDIRFIEEMPFNGEGAHYTQLNWTYKKILTYIQSHYPELIKLTDPANSTAYHYQVPGYSGKIGIIAAFSRTFCGTCNRIRITPQGTLKTCLYDDGVLNIRDLMRENSDNEILKIALLKAFQSRAKDGFEAEASRRNDLPIKESMSTIGG
jgi:molybdenum cofactor biosynthesis protein A